MINDINERVLNWRFTLVLIKIGTFHQNLVQIGPVASEELIKM
jgi:hypothetical protein